MQQLTGRQSRSPYHPRTTSNQGRRLQGRGPMVPAITDRAHHQGLQLEPGHPRHGAKVQLARGGPPVFMGKVDRSVKVAREVKDGREEGVSRRATGGEESPPRYLERQTRTSVIVVGRMGTLSEIVHIPHRTARHVLFVEKGDTLPRTAPEHQHDHQHRSDRVGQEDPLGRRKQPEEAGAR